jgi:molecular chaperone DnaJ
MARRDYYEVLGVPRDVGEAELKRAYRELAMRYHPDKNPGSREAEERFKEVSEAYTVLSDAESRARYDRLGHAGIPESFESAVGSFTELFDSLFGDLFGRKRARKETGRDLRYTLELEFVEAALGCARAITIAARGDCGACKGTGGRGGEAGLSPCTACAGKGEVKVQQGFFSVGKSCPSCGGTGKVVVDKCPECAGAGTVEREREFQVTIPAGTADGNVRRVPGQGEPGRRGGAAGDLNVIVRVKPHPLLKREGQVVACEVPVSFAQATLGATVDVPTLEGKVEMRVPAGTQSGTVFRLRGRGFPQPSGARGDAHVRVVLETPVELAPEDRALLERLDGALGEAKRPQQRDFQAKLKQLLDGEPPKS